MAVKKQKDILRKSSLTLFCLQKSMEKNSKIIFFCKEEPALCLFSAALSTLLLEKDNGRAIKKVRHLLSGSISLSVYLL